MKIDVVSWQFNKSYTDHPLGLTPNDAALPFKGIYPKSNDGLAWMGTFDDHPAEISSLAAMTRVAGIYRDQGMGCVPWMVVHLREPGRNTAAAEGTLAGQIAAAAGPAAVMIIDLEPHEYDPTTGFTYYLRDDLGADAGDVDAFVNAFLAAGGRELWMNPDARAGRMPTWSAWWARDEVTTVMPQVYWPDFRLPYRTALDQAITFLQSMGVHQVKNIRPMLPATATPADFVAAVEYCKALGCGGVSLYQRGNTSPALCEAIEALADPWAAVDPTPPPVSDTTRVLPGAVVDQARGLIRSIRNELDQLEAIVGG